MKETIIKIPKWVFEPAINQIKEFIGIGNIGKVYIVGDWNNWGNSPKKANCIRPKPEMEMEKIGNYYIWNGKLSIGTHKFKPAIVKTESDDSTLSVIWIIYPTGEIIELIYRNYFWFLPITYLKEILYIKDININILNHDIFDVKKIPYKKRDNWLIKIKP